MKTAINKYFSFGFGVAFGVSVGLACTAAVGDLVYVERSVAPVEIDAASAQCFATCAKNSAPNVMWDGLVADMLRVCVRTAAESSTGFYGTVQGKKYAPAATLFAGGPGNFQVIDVVE